MYFNPALMSQLRARPVAPGMQPPMQGSPMMGAAPGAPGAGGSPGSGLGGGLGRYFGSPKKGTAVNLPYFEEDRNRLGGMMDGQSPYASGNWGSLISQLEDRAAGRGPSIAGDAYREGAMNTQNAIASQARGSGSAAAGRQGLIQQGRISQGMAQGYASARNQEMVGAQGALTQALGSRDQLNQNAYLDLLAKQLGLSKDQLMALQGNQTDATQRRMQDKQLTAAKWSAVSGAFGGLGSIF